MLIGRGSSYWLVAQGGGRKAAKSFLSSIPLGINNSLIFLIPRAAASSSHSVIDRRGNRISIHNNSFTHGNDFARLSKNEISSTFSSSTSSSPLAIMTRLTCPWFSTRAPYDKCPHEGNIQLLCRTTRGRPARDQSARWSLYSEGRVN